MSKTTIEWTWMPGFEGDVWNPTTGCTRVSAGCDNCYAFALHDKRYASNRTTAKGYGFTDATAARVSMLAGHVDRVLPWPRQYDLPFSRVQLLEDRLDAPLRKRKPTCYFVDSMADLFHEDVPGIFIDRVFSTMRQADRHRFLILTKRPERMRAYISAFKPSPKWDGYLTRDGRPSNELDHGEFLTVPKQWPLPNVWLGTSVEDQRAADERIPHLLATPAAVRFLSCEPCLGPIDLTRFLSYVFGDPRLEARLHWVIVGGESGPRARPMDVAWARSLRDQCAAANVSVTGWPPIESPEGARLSIQSSNPGCSSSDHATTSNERRPTPAYSPAPSDSRSMKGVPGTTPAETAGYGPEPSWVGTSTP